MVFSVDTAVFYTYNPAIKNASTWPFDAPQYLLLNVAIDSNITPSFLQSTMEVDYVRVYQENALSIADQTSLSDIIVYPNPVSNRITIQIPNHLLGTKGKIYSILGQEVSSFSLNEIQSSIDVSHFKNGIYFLNVAMENGFKTFKIIKN